MEEKKHEFGALNTLLFVVILSICVFVAYIVKRNSFYYIPESAAAIFVGMVAGGATRLLYPSAEELQFLTLQPEIFFFILLPPIIFEAGYSLEKHSFFANLWTISFFAFLGTIVSTFVIGYLVYWLGCIGFIDIDTSSPVEALLFGSLISAIDPVATLSIMGNAELNVNPLLYSLVFGESVLNDAVAIVLFKTFLFFSENASHEQFLGEDALQAVCLFLGISLGSLVVGLFFGLICSFLCKRTALVEYPQYELSFLCLCVYGCYSFAEAVALSGIMSLFFCGITLAHYNHSNLSETSRVTSHYMFKALASLGEFIVYLYMGMGIFTGRLTNWHFPFFFVAIALCVLARFLNIFPLALIANYWRKDQIPLRMQLVQWFCGLRGAISFVLAMQLSPSQHRELYLSTTLLVVIGTTFICGGLTEPVLSWSKMKVLTSSGVDSLTAPYESVRLEDASVLSDAGFESEGGCVEGGCVEGGGVEMVTSIGSTGNPISRSVTATATTTATATATGSTPAPRTETLAVTGLSAWLQRMDSEYLMPIFSR